MASVESKVSNVNEEKHSNSVELDPNGSVHKNEYNKKLTQRIQTDVEQLNSGTLHRQRLNLDSDEKNVHFKNKSIYEPLGATLTSKLGIDVRGSPSSFNYKYTAKRRAHEQLLREINDEDEKFRILPRENYSSYRTREKIFANDWDNNELRYLTKEGRQDIIRPTRVYPAHTIEKPFKHKRKSLYGKFMERI